jgi:threonine dehydratase
MEENKVKTLHESLKEIKSARERLNGIITNTKLIKSKVLSEEFGNDVYLKPENLQVTGSFKIRGAYNKIIQLRDKEKARGIVASSAGNHAQGVAFASKELGVKATIVMPKTTPLVKVEATKGYGANVILSGNYYDDAYQEARRLEEKEGYIFVHPFNDWDVVIGQGTIALEVLEELPDIDIILVPIGGGGLISGIALAMKELKPSVKVIGVEPVGANAAKISLANNQLTSLEAVNTIAEGVAVKRPGELNFDIMRTYVDDVVTVTDSELMEAFLLLLEKHKILAENAGVITIAALKKLKIKDKNIVSVISGGNIDVLTISQMIRHGLVSKGRIFRFSVEIPDIPGELHKITRILSEQNANIVNLDHDQLKTVQRFKRVSVSVTLETNGHGHIKEIINAMEGEGYIVTEII